MTGLTDLRINMPVIGKTIDLSALRLNKLSVLGMCKIKEVPRMLVSLSIQTNPSHINLSRNTSLTHLTVMYSPNVNGYETLTRLQWLHLCKNTYLNSADIAAMTRVQSLHLESMVLTHIPTSVTDIWLLDCGDVSLANCTLLKKLSSHGGTRIRNIPTSVSVIIARDSRNITVSSLSELVHLKSLLFAGSSQVDAADLFVLTQLRALRILGGIISPALTPMTNIHSLTIGNVSHDCMTSLRTLPLLTTLSLSDKCNMTNDHLCVLTSLTRLSVFTRTISFNGVHGLINLTSLWMVNDRTMCVFTSLVHLHELVFIKNILTPQQIRLPLSIERFITAGALIKMKRDPSGCFMVVSSRTQ